MSERTLTSAEAARYLDVTERTLRSLVASAHLPLVAESDGTRGYRLRDLEVLRAELPPDRNAFHEYKPEGN